MKINLSQQTLDKLARNAREEEIASGSGCQDWDGKREAQRLGKIADELGMATRDEKGRFDLSREAFDWIMAELDWICGDYYGRVAKED